jgi:hypothetical protein
MFDDIENIQDEKNAIEKNEDEVDDGVWAPSCHCFCWVGELAGNWRGDRLVIYCMI